MTDFKSHIAKVATGAPLTAEEAKDAFDLMMSGETTPSQTGAFLMALRVRGETVEEITAAAQIMRAKALKVSAPETAMDIVGTGGDAKGTYNISTATSFVVAGAGVPVAKHGNRSVSSKSGAADVLSALGVKLDLGPAEIAACVREAGVGFMFAPSHHAAMKHVMASRIELGTRTIFNLLGPLTNPAGVKRELMGVFDRKWVKPLAQVLGNLGLARAWVVHGSDGMDELTTTGPTYVAEWQNGEVREFTVTPADAGLSEACPEDLIGGDGAQNAEAIRQLLNGEEGPFRDIVLLNAAAALIVAGKASDLAEGAALAAWSIDEGHARRALEKLIAVSNR